MRRWAPALLLTACSSTETGLVVVVGSDLEVPGALAVVRATVVRGDEGATAQNDFVLEGGAGLPFSFAIEPREGTPESASLTVVVEGRSPARDAIVEQRSAVRFVTDRRPVLSMFLARSCAGIGCGPDETCADGACRPQRVDAAALPEQEAGDEL